MPDHDEESTKKSQIDRLIMTLERIQFNEYYEYIHNRRRMVVSNLISGLARGLGFAIGFTLLGAIVIVFISNLAVDNIPLIGGFLADVIRIVQERL